MAELGTIQYTNVNQGTRVVDRSAEARAIGQGLDVAKTTINEGIKAKVTGDMLDAIDTVEGEEAPVLEPIEWPEGSREAHLSSRLDRLNRVIEQGKTSQKTLAEMQVKAVLAEAQANYPWLYQDLQARAGAVLAGSVKLEQLGLDDQARASGSKLAQDEYKRILDHAYTSWEDGGLGIPNRVAPRDPEFARQYAELSQLRDTAERGARLAGMAVANAQIDINDPRNYAVVAETLQGKYSLINSQLEEVRQRWNWAGFMANAAKGDQGDLRYNDAWIASNAEGMKQDLIQKKADMVQFWQQSIPVDIEGTERGKLLRARFDDNVAFFDEAIKAVDNLKDDAATSAQIIDRGMAIRGNDAFNLMPAPLQEVTAYANGPGKLMFEMMAEVKNPAGINLINNLGIAAQTHFAGTYSELFDSTNPQFTSTQQAAAFNSTGALVIPSGASAAYVQSKIDERMRDPSNTWVVPTRDNEEQQIAALHNKDLHLQLWKRAETVNQNASPEYADETLLGLTYSLSYMNGDSRKPKNVQEEMLNSLSDGSLESAMKVSLSGGSSGRRQAFGAEAEEYYHSTKPYDKRQEMAQYYQNHRIGDVALSELVQVDPNAIDENRFSYKINEEALTRAANSIEAVNPIGSGVTSESTNLRAQRRAEALATEAMGEVQRIMDRQIAIEMLINKAKANDANTMRQADDWGSHFLGAGDPAAQGRAWADIFNYSNEGSVTRSR